MNVWIVWFKNGDHVWLSATWEGPTDSLLWHRRIEDSRKLAHQRGYDIRVQLVEIPGVKELFESPRATAQARPMDWKMWGDSEVTYPLPVEAKTKP